jgi:hypothetical protein
MARSNTKKPSKAAAAARTVKRAAEDAVRAVKAEGEIGALLGRLSSPTAAQRVAVHDQFSDAECLALGGETKSDDVRDGGFAWASEASKALLDPSLAPHIGHSIGRLAWLVELLAQLEAAKKSARPRQDIGRTIRSSRDVARVQARRLRSRLASKLARVVRSDPVAIAAASVPAHTDDELQRALETLAAVAERAIKKHAVLAESARLTQGDATAARAMATALANARDDVSVGGRDARAIDPPAVNLIEGRIVHELRVLRDAWREAREDGVALQPLVPHPNLRRVLGSHPKKKNDDPSDDGSGGGSSTAKASA